MTWSQSHPTAFLAQTIPKCRAAIGGAVGRCTGGQLLSIAGVSDHRRDGALLESVGLPQESQWTKTLGVWGRGLRHVVRL